MTTLVVGAYAPELDRLNEVPDLVVRAVGIGLVDAAIGTSRAIAEVRPDRLILVGTAGVLPGAPHPLGAICVVEVAVLADRPCEYVPEPMMRAQLARADRALVEECRHKGELMPADCVSSIGVTRDAQVAAKLIQHGQLEQLECFAVLRAAQLHGVPATAMLAIANRVGPGAHEEWKRNRLDAEAKVQAALLRVLS